MFRFLHSADLHLGKPFGQFDEDLRGRLRSARIEAIGRLAAAARAGGAGTVLLAGDVFDAAEPPRRLVAQALDAMAAERDLRWLLLPGNHDPHRPAGLWERIAADRPENATLLLEPAPVEIAPGVVALPAPCRARRAGLDPTVWMDAAETPEGAVRLGVAHGPALDFTEDGSGDSLDPERPARAGLAYLALGDWHGETALGPRVRYSGTPETASFKRNGQGRALLVTLAGPAAPPEVAAVETTRFRWAAETVELLPGADALSRIGALVADAPRRDVLLSLRLAGETTLPERAALAETLERFGAGLAHFEADWSALAVRRSPEDLAEIAEGGPLRAAADALLAEASGEGGAAAREALDLLYSWSVGMEEGA